MRGLKKLPDEALARHSRLGDVSPVADANDDNAWHRRTDVRDNAVVAGAVFPELAEIGAFQRFTDGARIIELRHTLMKKTRGSSCRFLAELSQVSFG